VCLSITSKQAKVALECCHAVQGWKWRCSLIVSVLSSFFLISSVLTVTPFISMSLLEFICSTSYVCSIAGLLCY